MKLSSLIPETLGGADDNIWNIFLEHTLNKHLENLRYKPLSDLVSELRPKRILEIGVAQGWGAERMIKASKCCIEYYGLDLFDQPSKHIYEPASKSKIQKKLESLGVGKVCLFAGDSKEVLPRIITTLPKMDLIYIDGDHSHEGVKGDWNNAKKLMHANTVVVFDDYSSKKGGVKKVVDEINGHQISFIHLDKKTVQANVRREKKVGEVAGGKLQ